ncbi:MAG: hypothetical protein ACR2K1_08015, partial [Saprospiraceae bacterium]
MPHAVGFQPKHLIERVDRDVLEVIGAVFIRSAIQVGCADGLQCLEVIGVEIFRPVEHQVFK